MAKRKQKKTTRKAATTKAAKTSTEEVTVAAVVMDPEMEAAKELVSDLWWIALVRGIALAILGLLLLFSPAATVFSLLLILAVYWIVEGIVILVMAATGKSDAKWWVIILRSFFGIAAGLIVLNYPVLTGILTISFIVYTAAFMSIIGGILDIINAVHVRKGVKNDWSMMTGGVIALLFGMLILAAPYVSLKVFIALVGILGIIGGAALVFFAFQLRKLAK